MKSIKLYLKDKDSGEIEIKYVCNVCGKEMDEPKNYTMNVKGNVADPFSARFSCDDCKQHMIEILKKARMSHE